MIDQALPVCVTGRWKGRGKYPDTVWVEMSDGHHIAYDLRITQPEPKLERRDDAVGYGHDRRRTENG